MQLYWVVNFKQRKHSSLPGKCRGIRKGSSTCVEAKFSLAFSVTSWNLFHLAITSPNVSYCCLRLLGWRCAPVLPHIWEETLVQFWGRTVQAGRTPGAQPITPESQSSAEIDTCQRHSSCWLPSLLCSVSEQASWARQCHRFTLDRDIKNTVLLDARYYRKRQAKTRSTTK